MRIAVGSLSPAKLEAARLGFEAMWPGTEIELVGFNAQSGVADQPMTDEETLRGAKTRAKQALDAVFEADYGVGLEGGLQKTGEQHFTKGWIVVVDKEGHTGIGSTIGMPILNGIQEMIERGIELGHASDAYFGSTNSKLKQGYFGIVTDDRITRASGYRDAVVVALSHLEQLKKQPLYST